MIYITSRFYKSDTIRFMILKTFCLDSVFQALGEVDDLNLM